MSSRESHRPEGLTVHWIKAVKLMDRHRWWRIPWISNFFPLYPNLQKLCHILRNNQSKDKPQKKTAFPLVRPPTVFRIYSHPRWIDKWIYLKTSYTVQFDIPWGLWTTRRDISDDSEKNKQGRARPYIELYTFLGILRETAPLQWMWGTGLCIHYHGESLILNGTRTSVENQGIRASNDGHSIELENTGMPSYIA